MAYDGDGNFKSVKSHRGTFSSLQAARESEVLTSLWREFDANLPKQLFVMDAITSKTLHYGDNFLKLGNQTIKK